MMVLPDVAMDEKDAPVAAPQRVICLCAEWCVVCNQYRPQFDALAAQYPSVRFSWVDVEDEEAAMGEYDVETFPTLLISEGDEVRFLGPVLPQVAVVGQLLKRLMPERALTPDTEASALLQRLVSVVK